MKTDKNSQNPILSQRLSDVLDQLESVLVFDKNCCDNMPANENETHPKSTS